MLKKLIATSAVLVATTSVALATPVPYVGASVGFRTNTSTNIGNNHAANFYGVPFNLFAGYGGLVNQNVWIAGELFGTVATANLSSSNNAVKSTYGYGISFIPGYLLTDHTMVFVRAGYVRTRFSNVSTSANGGQVGIGMQSAVSSNIDIRGEYDLSAYRAFSNVSKPRIGEFNVGFVYKFE